MTKRLPLAAILSLALLGIAPPVVAPPVVTTPVVRTTAKPGIVESPSVRPGVTPTPNALFEQRHERLVYGTITAIREKTLIVVRLRNGYAQRVDMTDVLRTGHYSAPLFVGKIVAVTGRMEPTGLLLASTVTRAQSLKGMQTDRWILTPESPRP
jgi:hypothetical protein